jgi:hypothetical protein
MFPKSKSDVTRSMPLTRWASRAATGTLAEVTLCHQAGEEEEGQRALVLPPPVGNHRVLPGTASGRYGKEGPARLGVYRRGVVERGSAVPYRKEVGPRSQGLE